LQSIIDQAVYSEALGFDAVWLAEHHFIRLAEHYQPAGDRRDCRSTN
jgi:alkanesulfonate monooxygenase SsuD/methylene tetrahydromethanopterin reductase-like flavin-dependent oxidoreductase (luciferase family)